MTSVQTMRDIAFEKVNNDYAWGNYGDFKVLIMLKNGYINVTKLCKDGGKDLYDWKRTKAAEELQNEISRPPGIPGGLLVSVSDSSSNDLRGTYAHPDLVPHIASWVSPKFAVKVSQIVNEYFAQEARDKVRDLTKERNELLRKVDELLMKTDKIVDSNQQLIEKVDTVTGQNTELSTKLNTVTGQLDTVTGQLDTVNIKNEELLQKVDTVTGQLDTVNIKNEELLQKVDTVTGQLDTVAEQLEDMTIANEILDEKINVISKCLAVGPSTANKEMVFMLLSKRLKNKSKIYYIIRGQNKTAKAKRKKFRLDGYKTKMYFLDPNPIDLTDRVKVGLNNTLIIMRYNEFVLMDNVTEVELIKAIGDIRDEKYRECNRQADN